MKKVSSRKRSESTTSLVDVAKSVKTRMQQEKEMKKVFENIASKLLSIQRQEMSDELECKCREAVARAMSDLRQEVFSVEAATASRVSNLESKLHTLTMRLDDTQSDINKRLSSVIDDVEHSRKEWKLALESERNKRLTSLKKFGDQHEQSFGALQHVVETNRKDAMTIINSLSEDIRVFAKEVAVVKDKQEDM
jgi:hypothetical protein